jgi:hypothetical protein
MPAIKLDSGLARGLIKDFPGRNGTDDTTFRKHRFEMFPQQQTPVASRFDPFPRRFSIVPQLFIIVYRGAFRALLR